MKKAVSKQIQNIQRLPKITLAILSFFLILFVLNIYMTISTRLVEIDLNSPKQGEIKVVFSRPVSRLIAEVDTSPQRDFEIDWDRSSFRNSMYRDMVLETEDTKFLQEEKEYLVVVKGIRSLDRVKKIPVIFAITKNGETVLIEEAPEKFDFYSKNGEEYVRYKGEEILEVSLTETSFEEDEFFVK